MRKNHRFAFLVIGGLGLLAAVAPGLAAGISIPQNAADRPAAGTGLVEVQGFDAQDINWTIANDGRVTEVTFRIFRKSDTKPESSMNQGNATVRILLNEGAGAGKNATWNTCTLPADGTSGLATCVTTADGVDVKANSLQKVEILAFDSAS